MSRESGVRSQEKIKRQAMKMVVMIHIIIMVLAGCGLINPSDRVKVFIPGTYIRFSKNEFGNQYDTLIISLQNSSADEYKIVRKWKYERKVNSKPIDPEYKIKITSAIYDPKHKLLQEISTGRIYSVEVSSKCVFNGPVKYQKL